MQSAPVCPIPRGLARLPEQRSPKVHFGKNLPVPSIGIAPPDRFQTGGDLEQLNPDLPVEDLMPERSTELVSDLQKAQQAQAKRFQALSEGLHNGVDVVFKQAEWRKAFSQSNPAEAFLNQLQSVWDLTRARFRQAFPTREQSALKAALQPALEAEQTAKASMADLPHEAIASNSLKNPEAFHYFNQVIQKYPDLVLQEEGLPFDLGKEAASTTGKFQPFFERHLQPLRLKHELQRHALQQPVKDDQQKLAAHQKYTEGLAQLKTEVQKLFQAETVQS